MNKKVSLREIVATKIGFALLLTGYYWTWARSDWKPEYLRTQSVLGGMLIFLLLFHYTRVHKYKKESFDELAERNLKRCDAICFQILAAVLCVTAYLGGILGHTNAISTTTMGWILMLSLVALSIVRTILFYVMDTKGV